MYGATGTYMLGSFDGKTFIPESGKYFYTKGSLYAGQTYTNIPNSDAVSYTHLYDLAQFNGSNVVLAIGVFNGEKSSNENKLVFHSVELN